MKRIIEYFFPSSIMTDVDFISSMKENNIICIDGNIALYETKNWVDQQQTPITANDVFEFCSEVAELVGASKKVIVFDGLAPIQKLPEQIKRRKRRYNAYTELERDRAFDLSSEWYKIFISECEKIFIDSGWKVLSHKTIGEGEQKIADYVRYLSNTLDERYNIICWSKDWDIFVILLNIDLAPHIAVYLQMALHDIYQLISINKAQFALADVAVSPLHFMACSLMFGCDFFPGLQNMKLTPNNIEILINTKQFVTYNDNKLHLDVECFFSTLYHLRMESSDYRSMSSDETTDLDRSSMVLYSNVKTMPIEVEIEDCGGSCLMCDTKKHCSHEEMETSCYQYIMMFMWTLEYFYGLLDYKISDNSEDVYISFLSPNISSIMKWLETYNVEEKRFSVDIVSNEAYTKAMQEGLSLQFYELQQCRFIEMYQSPIICKTFNSMSVFRHQSS